MRKIVLAAAFALAAAGAANAEGVPLSDAQMGQVVGGHVIYGLGSFGVYYNIYHVHYGPGKGL